jgi:outer membrane protein assembly factor BamE (lipoprotein component of BamABCDE complex)
MMKPNLTLRSFFICLAICALLLIYGCSAIQKIRNTESTPQSQTETKNEQVIPIGSPLSKINKGMGTKEVVDVLGQPNDQEMLSTGKRWIPFYYGTDHMRQRWFYKNIGWIEFSGHGRVLHIRYDANEDGYR